MTIPNTTFPAATVAAASRATYAAFIGAGFAFASWASRIPQVRDQLELSSAELGLLLLAIAVGSLIALPLAGVIVHRLGSRRTVTAMAVLLGVGLLTVALGYLIGVVPVVIGLCLVGFANGAWDVAMNVQGASVEQHLGRSIMSRYHAGFSLGTVAGAGIGAVMVLASVPVTAHLLVVAIGTAVVVPLAVRGFLPDVAETADHGTETAEHRAEKADAGRRFPSLAGAQDAADRGVRLRVRLCRGHRQRLDRGLADRRLPGLGRRRHGWLRRLPDRDDGGSLVRTEPAGPLRAGRRGPHPRRRRDRRPAGVHLQPEHRAGLRRHRGSGAPAPRSASRWG